MFDRPTIYLSHPIRGSNGDIKGNCKKALAAARKLERLFPEVDFYCPAAGDLTLQILSESGRLSIDDIMFADLTILRACHGWAYLHFDESAGSMIEWEEAVKIGLTQGRLDWVPLNGGPIDFEDVSYDYIRDRFTPIVEFAVERFRQQA